jgi:hypothetical protein
MKKSALRRAADSRRLVLIDRGFLALSVVSACLAVVALGDLALRAYLRLEVRWDALSYHLPFAARRGGVGLPYAVKDAHERWYHAFPYLPDLVQGLLWRVTGSVNAAGLANYLALLLFLVYAHFFLRARFWQVALIALCAPLVIIHSATAYVDLFGNALLAIGLSSCLALFLFPERSSWLVLTGGLVGLMGAAWSKYQMAPLVGLAWLLFATVCLFYPPTRFAGKKRQVWAVLGVAALLIGVPYLRNLIEFGNPFWPMRMPFLSGLFPYTDVNDWAAERPPPLKDYAQLPLFFHSLFEINHPTHYDGRERWIVDQGNAWISFRMGGFWAVGVVAYLFSSVTILVTCRKKAGLALSFIGLGMLLFVGVLPQSNELRYYLFIPLVWAALIAMLFPEFRQKQPALAALFSLLTIGMFGYMVSENREHYRLEEIDFPKAATMYGADRFWSHMESGKLYCAVDLEPMGMLLTGPTMKEFSVHSQDKEEQCPSGAVVLMKDGSQHLKQ